MAFTAPMLESICLLTYQSSSTVAGVLFQPEWSFTVSAQISGKDSSAGTICNALARRPLFKYLRLRWVSEGHTLRSSIAPQRRAGHNRECRSLTLIRMKNFFLARSICSNGAVDKLTPKGKTSNSLSARAPSKYPNCLRSKNTGASTSIFN